MTNSGEGEPDRRSERRPGTGGDSLVDEIPWKRALMYGIVAFAVGIVLVTGLVFIEGALDDSPDESGDVESDEDEPGVLTVMGWLYFSTQFVDIEASGAFGSETFDMLAFLTEDGSIPELVWRLAPVLALVAAGYLLASRELDADATPEEGAKMGAYVTVGYLLAVVFGSQLFTFTDTGAGESVGVAFSQAVLLSGLLYPVLFGAIGGYLAFRT